MSNFNGRPNVTQYIANLNKIQQEPSMSASQDPAGLEPDFAPFVGNDLFDFDMGELGDLNEPLGYDAVQEDRARRQNAAAHRQNTQQPDFLNTDMTFPDFSNTNFSGIPNAGTNIAQTNPYPMNIQSSTSPVSTFPGARVGDKRKASDITIQHANPYSPVEEGSRHAAEEDKRRRNTAASARFRVKKKQREQAMEKTAKEMTEKVSLLEAKINQLEMENKWLKAMVLEKTGKKVEEELSGRWREEKKAEMRESSTEKRNDGVGTKDDEDGEGEGEED